MYLLNTVLKVKNNAHLGKMVITVWFVDFTVTTWLTGSCSLLLPPTVVRRYHRTRHYPRRRSKFKTRDTFPTECIAFSHHHKVKKILKPNCHELRNICNSYLCSTFLVTESSCFGPHSQDFVDMSPGNLTKMRRKQIN